MFGANAGVVQAGAAAVDVGGLAVIVLQDIAERAVEDAFERMFELTRSQPAPTLAERLDQLARLRAAVSENEARFEQAISADFGHRSRIETAIAETLLVLGEIKHAAKHLKKWIDRKSVV